MYAKIKKTKDKFIYDANLSIFMELYPNSNSGYPWNIEFSTGASNATNKSQLDRQYKIRFDN